MSIADQTRETPTREIDAVLDENDRLLTHLRGAWFVVGGIIVAAILVLSAVQTTALRERERMRANIEDARAARSDAFVDAVNCRGDLRRERERQSSGLFMAPRPTPWDGYTLTIRTRKGYLTTQHVDGRWVEIARSEDE